MNAKQRRLARIYREAAERVDSNREEFSCIAIADSAGWLSGSDECVEACAYLRWLSLTYLTATERFAATEQPPQTRVLALLLASQAARTGDLTIKEEG